MELYQIDACLKTKVKQEIARKILESLKESFLELFLATFQKYGNGIDFLVGATYYDGKHDPFVSRGNLYIILPEEQKKKIAEKIGQEPDELEKKLALKNGMDIWYSNSLSDAYIKEQFISSFSDKYVLNKTLAGVLDLSGYLKCFCFHQDKEEFFQQCQTVALELQRYDIDSWRELCHKAIALRNEFYGHETETKTSLVGTNEFKEKMNILLEMISKVANETNKTKLGLLYDDYINEMNLLEKSPLAISQYMNGSCSLSIISFELSKHYAIQCYEGYALAESEDDLCTAIKDIEKKKVSGEEENIESNNLIQEEQNDNHNSVRVFKELAEYRKGDLSIAQIEELFDNFRIVFDVSIFLTDYGRKYISDFLVTLLSRREGNTKKISILATSRLNLFLKTQEYKMLDETFRTSSIDEKEKGKIREKIKELEKYRTAYIFLEDIMNKTFHLVECVDKAQRNVSDGEAIITYLNEHSDERICVLATGAMPYIKSISSVLYPNVVFGRLRREGNHAEFSLFSEYTDVFTPHQRKVCESHTDSIKSDSVHIKDIVECKSEEKNISMSSSPVEASTIKGMDKTRIVLNRPVSVGDTLYTENGDPIQVKAPITQDSEEMEGGEGKLYLVDINDKVAKIYHTSEDNYKLTIGRREKLQEMVMNNPNIPQVCWPEHMLYNKEKVFVGYLMPLVSSDSKSLLRSVLQIGKPTIRDGILKNWDRKDLVVVAKRCAELMDKLHSKGILMGDVNGGNFLVDINDSSNVHLVDCDSYQFGGYPCPVGTEDFTHPDTATRLGIQGELHFDSFLRTVEEEDFVFAMLVFQILFLNEYPFTIKGNITPSQAMKEKQFPYANAKNVPDGPDWMIWKNLPKGLSDKFTKVFRERKHISAEELKKELTNYEYLISKKGYSREIVPKKYINYDLEDPTFLDVKCDICGNEFNVHKDKLGNKYYIPRCRECNAIHEKWKNISAECVCEQCGKTFQGNQWEAYLHEINSEKFSLICSECSNPTLKCDVCGHEFKNGKGKPKKRPYFCRDCWNDKKVVPLTCSVCKKKRNVSMYIYKDNFGTDKWVCWSCKKK